MINAFNLIDGLDGLAGGVGLIASLILAYVCFLHRTLPGMLYMVAIAGGLLGFLRYNFHPASVFMGDGGSYFLGYLLGVVSVLGAGRNTATMTFLVPMLAVALPVIDVTIAILRRFVRGQGIFRADKRQILEAELAGAVQKDSGGMQGRASRGSAASVWRMSGLALM